jgi:hypothetical protein
MIDPETDPRQLILVSAYGMNEPSPWSLPEDVFHYVQVMLEGGQYRRNELAPAAVQLHSIHRYRGEVCNGGHSQYIGNVCPGPDELERIEVGLTAIGADSFLENFRAFRTWLETHPDEAETELRPAALDPLDSRLYALDEDHALHRLLKDWILRQPGFVVVPNADYPQRLKTLAEHNPLR